MSKLVEIELLLNEFRALCVLYAWGKATNETVLDYQRKILNEIQLYQEHCPN